MSIELTYDWRTHLILKSLKVLSRLSLKIYFSIIYYLLLIMK